VDLDAEGIVPQDTLKEALNSLGIFPTLEELELFIYRYDADGDGALRFSEFADAFAPRDAYYAGLLNKRQSNKPVRVDYKEECFCLATHEAFKDAWDTHFKVETKGEYLRLQLSKKPYFNLADAFAACDADEDGKISKEEIKFLMERKGLFVSEKEVRNLVDKFDRDGDGRISFHEVS